MQLNHHTRVMQGTIEVDARNVEEVERGGGMRGKVWSDGEEEEEARGLT